MSISRFLVGRETQSIFPALLLFALSASGAVCYCTVVLRAMTCAASHVLNSLSRSPVAST
ncbi:hypothetical protein [Protofrankia symbiont of Coriaria ruscifolia]|uniref:Putative membrane protein n=1 Tax=Candidatus Protofrankia californiensis TaxID=1839754 RepID=A0A1C3P4W5_9ACTN|nr:hypothetical protein [Protofrankia symbiont of Coriaria ruscifolia]SBW24859.1 putative membrane protein [Candidatus Protofrankia californiensis]